MKKINKVKLFVYAADYERWVRDSSGGQAVTIISVLSHDGFIVVTYSK